MTLTIGQGALSPRVDSRDRHSRDVDPLPLVLPATLGSALLVLVQAMGLFSVPAVLGMPGGFYVAGTEIYRLLNNFPPRVSQAAAWGVLLLVVTAGLVWLQGAILRRRSFVTVTGKAYRPRTLELGRVRYLLAAAAWAYVAASVILPVGTLSWAALRYWLACSRCSSWSISSRSMSS